MRLLAFVLVLLLLLTGCAPRPGPTYRVVTEVTVTASHNARVQQYRYSDHLRMQAVLNYLRKLETYAPEEIAADTFRGDAFQIILHRSDGTEVVYNQIADGYLQKDGGEWLKTDARHASSLLRLLQTMEQESKLRH